MKKARTLGLLNKPYSASISETNQDSDARIIKIRWLKAVNFEFDESFICSTRKKSM